jgi:hypothetical protein
MSDKQTSDVIGYVLGDAVHPAIPIIPAAVNSTGYASFVCLFCNSTHVHINGLGWHKHHCTKGNSPFRGTGYLLVGIGEPLPDTFKGRRVVSVQQPPTPPTPLPAVPTAVPKPRVDPIPDRPPTDDPISVDVWVEAHGDPNVRRKPWDT